MNNEFKDRLVTINKAKNLKDLIVLLCNMDTNMKKISKQSQLRIKSHIWNFLITKPLFKSYNSASTKLSTTIGGAITSPVPSTVARTHLGPIDVFNVIRQGPIL